MLKLASDSLAPNLEDIWLQAEHFGVSSDELIFDDIIVCEYLTFMEVMRSAATAIMLQQHNLLVDQTLRMAKDYGLQAVRYVPGEDLDDRFLSGQSVTVATYAALFNGQSRFGLAGGQRDIVQVGGLILDDAHTAFTDMRAVFSFSIDSGELRELYAELTHLFRPDFEALGPTKSRVVRAPDSG